MGTAQPASKNGVSLPWSKEGLQLSQDIHQAVGYHHQHHHSALSMPGLNFENITSEPWGSLVNHVLTEHLSSQLPFEAGCGNSPCLLTTVPFPLEQCSLPLYHLPMDMGRTPFHSADLELSDLACGQTISDPASFINHVQRIHWSLSADMPDTPLSMQSGPTVDSMEWQSSAAPELQTASASPREDSASHSPFDTQPSTASPPTPDFAESQGTNASCYACMWQDDGAAACCGKNFGTAEELHSHIKGGHAMCPSETGFYCQWAGCPRTDPFPQKSKLERHMQTHTACKSAI